MSLLSRSMARFPRAAWSIRRQMTFTNDDLSDLAEQTVMKLGNAATTDHARYKIIANQFFFLDKGLSLKHQVDMLAALNKIEHYKSLASDVSKRAVVENLFRLIISAVKADATLGEKVLAAIKSNYLKTTQRVELTPHKTDHSTSLATKDFNFLLSTNPTMTHINRILVMPNVFEALRPVHKMTGNMPTFHGQLMYGVLCDPVHDANRYLTVCVGSDEPNMAFFKELAGIFGKPLETYDEIAARAGEVLVMNEIEQRALGARGGIDHSTLLETSQE